jgi:defect-in-organelle-trafficking protein DotC
MRTPTPLISLSAAMSLALATFSAPTLSQSAAPVVPPSLEDLVKTGPDAATSLSGVPDIRYRALRDSALVHGTQAGLARGNFDIQAALGELAVELDRVFDFQRLLLDGLILPPVIVEGRNSFDQPTADFIRIRNTEYTTLAQPYFVYAPPTWRSYLVRDFTFDPKATPAVAAKDDKERAVWRKYVVEGYAAGQEQAREIFKENFARLMRDYRGMQRYHTLLARGMMTRPYVVSTNQGVQGDKSKLVLGETTLRVTVTPEYVTDQSKWTNGAIKPGTTLNERLRAAQNPETATTGREARR